MWEGDAFLSALIKLKEVKLRVRNKLSRPWFDKRDLDKLDGDWSLAFYYAVLKDYSNRLNADKKGFTRVSSKMFEADLKANRMKIWRYNKRLEDKGLIVVDRVARGRSTWIGYKLI